jgi:MFS family permease
MPGLTVLAAVMLCSGLAVSPMLISGFSIIERQAPPNRRSEAMAWLTSAISVGTAVGSAAAGQIIDTDGARWGYALAGAFAAAAMLTCLLGLAKLTVPTPTAHADDN